MIIGTSVPTVNSEELWGIKKEQERMFGLKPQNHSELHVFFEKALKGAARQAVLHLSKRNKHSVCQHKKII